MDKPLVILGSRLYAEEIYDVATEIPGCRVEAFFENWDRARRGDPVKPVSPLD